jgi:hypothetical protein
MAPEGDTPEVSGDGALATDKSVAAGKEGQAAGRDIHNYPPVVDSGGKPVAVVAIVALVIVFAVMIFAATLAFWPEKALEATPSLAPIDTPSPAAVYGPTATSAPTPADALTPTPDSGLAGAIYLIGDAHRYIINEVEGRSQMVTATEIWCPGVVEEMLKYIEQQKRYRGLFFDLLEGPVMGQDSCSLLQNRYIGKAVKEDVGGFLACTVERWAFLPKETEKPTVAEEVVSTYYFEVIDERLCISDCRKLCVWYNSDHLNSDYWRFVSSDAVWPTRVPETH